MLVKIILILLSISTPVIAQGNCTHSDVSHHIHRGNTAFEKNWAECGMKTWGAAQATTDCLLEIYGQTLSRPCASCFGDSAGCMRSNCWLYCFGGRGPACNNCGAQYCQEPLERCTGIPNSQLPSSH